MAFYKGYHKAYAAGMFITLLDTYLTLNANWTCYDAAAGTNAKTYRCTDGVTYDFYVHVDNNYNEYAILRLWAGWDSGAHAGSGNSTANSFWRVVGQTSGSPYMGWALRVRDSNFIYISQRAKSGGMAQYCGEPVRFNTAYDTPLITGGTAYTTYLNCLGDNGSASGSYWRLLQDDGGATGKYAIPLGNDTTNKAVWDMNWKAFIFETPIYSTGSNLLLGYLDGVMNCQQPCESDGQSGIVNAQVLYEPDGTGWYVVQNTTGPAIALIRMD